MKGKVKSVLVIFFAATILTIGTGIIPMYRASSQNWSLPLLVLSVFSASSGNNPAAADTNTSTLSSQYRETKLIKEVNDGFKNWLLNDGKSSAFTLTLAYGWNNETGLKLFSEFLQKNPNYAEKFNEYMEIQSKKNDLKAEQACLTDQEIEELITYGTVVNKWNSTIEINGTNWPCNYREYVLQKGEETLRLLKIIIYANETIIDPYIAVTAWPLIAYIWPFGWICFGQDVYLHIRAPYIIEYNGQQYSEAAMFVNYIHSKVDEVLAGGGLAGAAIGAILGAALGARAGPVGAAIGAIIGAVIGVFIIPSMLSNFRNEADLALTRAGDFFAKGNNYGVKMVVKDHYIYPGNPLAWLPLPWLSSTFSIWFVWPDNTWKCGIPEIPIDPVTAGIISNNILSLWWCWGAEVWVLPYYIYL